MCSAPAVNKTMRIANAISTGGISEGVRAIAKNNPDNVLSKATMLTETGPTMIYNYAAKTLGASPLPGTPGANPAPPPPPPPDENTGDQPRPGGVAPGQTSVDSLQARRRKRLAQLQGGLASTIATGPGGAAGSPSLLSPSAGGLKLKLGA